MNMEKDKRHPYIVQTPGVCGGEPRIDGRRIRVQDVAVDYERLGMTPDEICDAYPGLTLAEVHAALAYYYDHRQEIHEQMQEAERQVEEFKRQHPDWVQASSFERLPQA
jgi:uncharacterized protein (DUF433 family)